MGVLSSENQSIAPATTFTILSGNYAEDAAYGGITVPLLTCDGADLLAPLPEGALLLTS